VDGANAEVAVTLFDTMTPESYVLYTPHWGKLLHASQASSGTKDYP
jgi:hypothetical protein